MIMKEMEYKGLSDTKIYYREVIDEGNYKGFNYYILNLGTHPCSYIEIPEGHKLYKKHYMDNDLDEFMSVHGGITYSDEYLTGVSQDESKWFIGWDYAHAGDYMYYKEDMEMNGHKWTVQELHEEIIEVIDELAEKSQQL